MSSSACLAVLALQIAAGAGDGARPNPHLAAAHDQVIALQEQSALATLERARLWPKNTAHELALIHLYEGLAYAGLSREKEAVESFRTALLLAPSLTLPGEPSPRVVRWFEAAGGSVASGSPPVSAASPAARPAPRAPSAAELELGAPGRTGSGADAPEERPSISGRTRTAWTWAGAVLVAAGAGTLLTAALVGRSAAAQADRARAEPNVDPAMELQRKAEGRARTANLLLLGGGAGAAAGTVLLLW